MNEIPTIDINIINSNARSLRPKVNSLIDCMKELSATFAVITETWFANGSALELETENLLLGSGIDMLVRNREPTPGGLSHGGVAVLSFANRTKMKIYPFANPDNYEVLPVAATVHGLKRKVFIIGVYVPPGYPASRGRGALEHVSNIVLTIKAAENDPLICITGDFNQWLIEDYLLDYPDITEVITPPTRKDRRIDRTFTNWTDSIVEKCCLQPLETDGVGEEKRCSDHLVQFSRAPLPRKNPVKAISYSYRPNNATSAENFRAELESKNWDEVLEASGPNIKERRFQAIIDDMMDRHFPMKVKKYRETDLPWMNETARKMIKKKRVVYKAEARSERWLKLREDVEAYLEKRRKIFLERQRENLTGPDAHRQFYKNVKNYSTAEREKDFDVRELFPNETEQAVAEKVADFFNEISLEFSPLEPCQVPTTYDKVIPLLSLGDVESRLKKQKKPNSMVAGDLFPKMINSCSGPLSTPLASIYNAIIQTKVWPIAWKREYVTVIPKRTLPDSLGDLRNI